MTRFFALSLFFHLILAIFAVLLANPIRIAVDNNHIAVSVLLNAASEDLTAPHPAARTSEPKAKRDPKIREHYHAAPEQKNAVIEGPDAHPALTAQAAAAEASGGHHGSLDENTEYLTAVLDLVSKAKRYPKISQDREEEGLVILAVSLKVDGTIVDVRPEQTTPFERLNRAAVDTVRSIQKFPAPPANSGAEVMTLHIPIRYKLERS